MRSNLLSISCIMLIGCLNATSTALYATPVQLTDVTKVTYDGSRENQGKGVKIQNPVTPFSNTNETANETFPLTIKINNSSNIESAGEVIYAVPSTPQSVSKHTKECYDLLTVGESIDLPVGEYDIIVYVSTQSQGSFFFAKENVNISEAQTINFDLAEASIEINFMAKKPNGDVMVQQTLDWDTYDILDEGNTLWNFAFITVRHKSNEPLTELAFFNYDEIWQYSDGTFSEAINDMTHVWAMPTELLNFGYMRVGGMPEGLYHIALYSDNVNGIVSNNPTDFRVVDYNFQKSNYEWPWQEYSETQRHNVRNICLWDGDVFSGSIKSMCGWDYDHPNDVYYSPTNKDDGAKFEILPVLCSAEGIYRYKVYNIFSQPALLDDNGEIYFSVVPINNDGNIDETCNDPTTFKKNLPVSPHRSQYGNLIWGSTAPSLSWRIYLTNSGKNYSPIYDFYGRYGENRSLDRLAKKFNVKRDDVIIAENDDNEFVNAFSGSNGTVKGKYDIEITNDNLTVDGITSNCSYHISFDLNQEDSEAPTMRFLQFVNSTDGSVTERFENQIEGLIEFTAGDFSCVTDASNRNVAYTYHPIESVIVEYAPNGNDDYTELTVNEVPELFTMPGYGAFYRGSMKDITKESANKWYDLRVTLTDAAGNYQQQVISPAFRIEEINTNVGIKLTGDTVETISVVDGKVFVNGEEANDVKIFDAIGTLYNNDSLISGVYFIKTETNVYKVFVK